ncbi:hypothetical protein DFH05DRAFT_1465821 [Lentinula detonsa]|uniref:DinB-like domain-containing protein n=2 Tax=Lentinula TaxID=5352 RepID=A0A9W8PA36_9AGAR|nr:hypothetical protein DFH05DRAFT_1465821 [Lentinula detonsa]KAJ3990430.1 hypothetical protein F5890DRAFT_1479801 [Lentinula detonsa]
MSLTSQPLPSMTVQLDENATNVKDLLFVSQTVLQQAVDLLDNDLKEDEQLVVTSKFLPGSTIGKHLRHARDHFELLINCITSPPPYVLNYDVRSRNTPMETSRGAARSALLETIQRLQDVVPTSNWNAPITLNAVTPFPQTFQTTFARELWFGALHCVHHWSMVRVIAGEMNMKVGDDCFGFAPSTLVASGREHSLGKTMAKI